MENPIRMDDLGVPLFSETSMSMGLFATSFFGSWFVSAAVYPSKHEIKNHFKRGKGLIERLPIKS